MASRRIIIIAAAWGVLGASAGALADIKTFSPSDPNNQGDWHVAGNWSPEGVPTGATRVT